MSYESFTLEKDGHVANMTLCRGESFNTMTKKFWIELPEILNAVSYTHLTLPTKWIV